MASSTLNAWVLATRPKTLVAAAIPILVGTALASAMHESVRPALSVLAFLSTIFIQIGTNFINDSLDFKKGADTHERVGPQRVTQGGLISAKNVWLGGLVCFGIAALLAIPLVLSGGWPIIVIGILSLLAGYIYTGGPYPLAYVGLGDLFVLIFFGWVAVMGVYYLHTDQVDLQSFVAGTQVGLLATVLIAINNFRDSKTDVKAHKKTLAVRLGPTFARAEIALLCLVPFLCGAFWYSQGYIWASLLPVCIAPLALMLNYRIHSNEPGRIYNKFLAQGALLHLVFGVLLSVGFFLK